MFPETKDSTCAVTTGLSVPVMLTARSAPRFGAIRQSLLLHTSELGNAPHGARLTLCVNCSFLLMSSAPGIQRRRRHMRGVKFTRQRVRYPFGGVDTVLHELLARIAGRNLLIICLLLAGGPCRVVMSVVWGVSWGRGIRRRRVVGSSDIQPSVPRVRDEMAMAGIMAASFFAQVMTTPLDGRSQFKMMLLTYSWD